MFFPVVPRKGAEIIHNPPSEKIARAARRSPVSDLAPVWNMDRADARVAGLLPQDAALLQPFRVVSKDEMDRGFEPGHKFKTGRPLTYKRPKPGYLELSGGD